MNADLAAFKMASPVRDSEEVAALPIHLKGIETHGGWPHVTEDIYIQMGRAIYEEFQIKE